jgi:hypothetical protein
VDSCPLAGRRQYTLTLRGDATELAYMTQLKAESKAEREAANASESAYAPGAHAGGQDDELLPPGLWVC